jgi:hypothetical protein
MVDWLDLTHWQAILAAIVAIGTPIVTPCRRDPWVATTTLVWIAL